MTDPWKIKTEDVRQADSLPTFIIFCEDEVSEPVYFKYFETTLIKVNPIKGQRSKTENVLKAITHCITKGLMEYTDGIPKLSTQDTHVWCVYDRDCTIENKQIEENTSFNAALETAKLSDIKVAWSNDAFELWVLLHFEDVDPNLESNKSRKTYYDRLTDIFKNLPNPNEDLVKALQYGGFNYKQSLKSTNNFRNIVRNEITANTKIAIDRAKILEAFHANATLPPHEIAPCTKVHHLIEELIHYGKKGV